MKLILSNSIKMKSRNKERIKKQSFHLSRNLLLGNWKLLLIGFILLFFLTLLSILKYFDVGWDFFAYYLTGKSFFSDSFYSEPYRPFILPLILGVLDKIFFFLPDKFVSVIYVILASILFFYALLLVTKKYHLNYLYSLLFFLTPYFFHYSFLEGTELLAFSILLLTIYLSPSLFDKSTKNLEYFYTKKIIFLLFFLLWLLFFIRYSLFIFMIFYLIYDTFIISFKLKSSHSRTKNYKKTSLKNHFYANFILSFLINFLIFSPWFIINFIMFRDPIMLIKDQYAQNVYFRCIPISWDKVMHHFLEIFNPLQLFILVLFLIIILYLFFKKEYKTTLLMQKRSDLIFYLLIILIFNIFIYLKTPTKISRYLFLSHVSLQLLSLIGFQMLLDLCSNYEKNDFLIAVMLIFIFMIIFNLFQLLNQSLNLIHVWKDETKLYTRIIKLVNDLNLTNYELNSNLWVPLIFYGLNVLPSRDLSLLNYSLGIYLKTNSSWLDEATKIYPIYYNDSRLIIVGIKNQNKTKHYTYIYHKLVKYFNKEMPSTLELFFGDYCKKIHK